MACAALVSALEALGCHQTDIGDAMYQADPDWLDGGCDDKVPMHRLGTSR
jgi:hypothetical protein